MPTFATLQPHLKQISVTVAYIGITATCILLPSADIVNVVCHKSIQRYVLTLKVLVMTIDAQWEWMGDVGLARYEPALFPPCPTIMVLNYSN